MRNILLYCLACSLTISSALAQKLFTAQQLQADFAVLRKSYETLHPGLYKYADKTTIDGYFAECQQALNHDQSLTDAYLTILKLTARFKCGHSYPNFYNQEGDVKTLFEQKNCLPFWFRLVDNRMVVTWSADTAVPVGVEIQAIDGVPVRKIIQTMLPLVRADGSNDGKRRDLLQIGGQKYEYFDVLLPMLFPSSKPTFTLKMNDLRTKKLAIVTVNGVLHTDRNDEIKRKYPSANDTTATFGWLDANTALMRINTFANWKTEFDFGKFYDESIAEFVQKNGQNLIIDSRRNEGGDFENGKKLIRHLITTPVVLDELQDCWAYTSMDSSLSPYIQNRWGYEWRYRPTSNFDRLPSGQYREKGNRSPEPVQPATPHLSTHIYLLTSATNSSAGLLFANALKTQKLATLVGQTTGGNQKGITAGALFFMQLPNSGIEVDVPLIGMDYNEAAKRPDAGVAPDVYVKPDVMDVVSGIDTEMNVVRARISRRN
ncbi:S41 family peptidase [Spirosoma arcticum]